MKTVVDISDHRNARVESVTKRLSSVPFLGTLVEDVLLLIKERKTWNSVTRDLTKESRGTTPPASWGW